MVYAALLAVQEEHTSGPLTVEGGLMLWTVVIFLLLLLILKRFAWPAIEYDFVRVKSFFGALIGSQPDLMPFSLIGA